MISFRFEGAGFAGLFDRQKQAVMTAAQLALVETARAIDEGARASIAAAGFSTKWQDALSVRVNEDKAGGGAIGIRHGVPFAMIFETGGTIEGKPWLWLPLPACPKSIGGGHPTPAAYVQTIGPLKYLAAHGRPLLIGQTATPPKAPPPPGVKRLSGPRVEKVSALRAGAKVGGYAVPLFFGVEAVTIAKKFDVLGVVERAYADLARAFAAHLQEG